MAKKKPEAAPSKPERTPFGAWVIAARGALTQEGAAAKSKISRTTIANWERGAQDPDWPTVQAYAAAFPNAPPPPGFPSTPAEPTSPQLPLQEALTAALGRRASALSGDQVFALQKIIAERQHMLSSGFRGLDEAGADTLLGVLLELVPAPKK